MQNGQAGTNKNAVNVVNAQLPANCFPNFNGMGNSNMMNMMGFPYNLYSQMNGYNPGYRINPIYNLSNSGVINQSSMSSSSISNFQNANDKQVFP